MAKRSGAYAPYQPLRRPGGKPSFKPAYRVLIHHSEVDAWNAMVEAVGEESASQCWDHLATIPGSRPHINSATPLRGKQFGPTADGFSRVMHYRAGSAARVDYRFHDDFRGGDKGDSHKVTAIRWVGRSSSGT